MNLIDVTKQFRSEEDCLAYLESTRWPDGVACLKCGGHKISRIASKGKTGKPRRLYQCLDKACRHQFTATTGTIFHDTHLPLTKWFLAIALICQSKKGISANEIASALRVEYRTAWYLCHRIRKAMEESPERKLVGTVEVDETYIGGKYDRRRKRGPWEKQAVVGLIERGGKVHAEAIPTPSKSVLVGVVKDHVSPEADVVITDENASYKSLRKTHRHAVINHLREYVHGTVHTNTIENFWSLLKRGIIGNFHQVSVKYLPLYLAEFQFRFNARKHPNLFGLTMVNLLRGMALSYRTLIADSR